MTVWHAHSTPEAVADALVALYEAHGDERYDEAVDQTTHAVQAAELAREAGADDTIVAAALLHDVGHLLPNGGDRSDSSRGRDLRHEEVAARFLARWFDPAVTEPIRGHVAAKRYLCATEPGYFEGLSPASVRSLVLQGGPMTPTEVAAFEQLDGAAHAVELRRWDDLAKDPGRTVAPIHTYRPLLTALARLPPAR